MELVAGVDEAGRGPLAGPVVASAVILSPDNPVEGLRDSKKLSALKRDKLYHEILDSALSVGIGIVDNDVIDRINILNATHRAMKMSLGRLNVKPTRALIDGYGLPTQIIPNEGVIKGDDKIDCIRAASIVAKVTRDQLMEKWDIVFPEYGFAGHKGYGTKQHMEALQKWKPSPIHRKSFRPVKENLKPATWYRENKKIGWLGEKLAAMNLQDKGYAILEMNKRVHPYGEIDIIAEHSGDVVFLEIKTGMSNSRISPVLNLSEQKMIKLESAINKYMQDEQESRPIRFEAMTVTIDGKKHSFDHIKHVDFNFN